MDKGAKYGIALLLIGVVIFFFPTGTSAGNIWTAIVGSSPWIVGSNGQTTTTSGGTTTTTLIPSGAVDFKMSLVASYSDGTNETVFSKSTLPGLAVVSLHGKQVREVDAFAIAAVQTSSPLASGSYAHFDLNFSAWIPALNKVKWTDYSITVPLINNGTLALATLPPLPVLPSDAYSDNPKNATSREVDWTVLAVVDVYNAAGVKQLSLLNNDLSSLTLNWDGTIVTGCTDCGGSTGGTGGGSSGGTTIGGITSPSAGAWTITNPRDDLADLCSKQQVDPARCGGNPPAGGPTSTESTINTNGLNNEGGITVPQPTETETNTAFNTPGAVTGTATVTQPGTTFIATQVAVPPPVVSTVIKVDSDGTVHVNTTTGSKTTTVSYKPNVTKTTSAGGGLTYAEETTSSGSIANSGIKPGMNKVLINLLPLGSALPISWIGPVNITSDTVALINPGFVALMLFFALIFAYAVLTGKRKTK
jgi:hypothetical protein